MRICYLYTAENAHIQKWVKFFSSKGHEVHLITMYPGQCEGAQIHLLNTKVTNKHASDLKKLDYLFHGKELRQMIQKIDPDIIHAHYISSYGAMCAVAGIKPFWLSIWGSDVYDFPRKSPLHRFLVRFTLQKAIRLLSTSHAMAEETRKYTDKQMGITPFGVDMELFSPEKRTRNSDGKFIVGTVKALEDKYGIDDILTAASHVVQMRPDIPLEIRVAGTGTKKDVLKQLGQDLGIDNRIHWLGQIPQAQAAIEWANLDAAIVPSRLESESFGVAAVEAQSCEVPVIISDIPGLMEATKPSETSIVVKRNHPKILAEKIIWLYDHPNEAKQMGISGRKYVSENYELEKCFGDIEHMYLQFLKAEK